MGRSHHSVQQTMECTRKTSVHHRRRFKLNCTAWIWCFFILNASTGSSAQLRQCTEVRDRSYSCFCNTYWRTSRFIHLSSSCICFCTSVFFFLKHSWLFGIHLFVLLRSVSLLIAYVQQDVFSHLIITKVTGASDTHRLNGRSQ